MIESRCFPYISVSSLDDKINIHTRTKDSFFIYYSLFTCRCIMRKQRKSPGAQRVCFHQPCKARRGLGVPYGQHTTGLYYQENISLLWRIGKPCMSVWRATAAALNSITAPTTKNIEQHSYFSGKPTAGRIKPINTGILNTLVQFWYKNIEENEWNNEQRHSRL